MTADLEVKLMYAHDEGPGKSHYYYTSPLTEEQKKETGRTEQHGGKTVPVNVLVKDGRGKDLKLNECSFELVEQETTLSTKDFFNDQDKVKSIYYPEIAKLVKEKTGAEHVVVFHHQVRAKTHNASAETGVVSTIQPYAYGVHSDSHPNSAKDVFKMFARGLDKKYHKGRFLYINAWRNITDTPIGNDHLAVCDERSVVKPDDYIVAEFHDKMTSLQQYKLLDFNKDNHDWFYFPGMRKNEVLLFKQFDSDTKLKGRLCFHTAFNDPNAEECPERQSVEARCMAFFPDHTPNTCPEIAEVVDDLGIPSAKDKDRVQSKDLFDFKLKGVYDDEVYDDIKKNKVNSDYFKEMLAAAVKGADKGKAVSQLIRNVFPYIKQAMNTEYFQEKFDCCTHETVYVPKEYSNDVEIPVLVHRPKNITGKSAAIIFAHSGNVIVGSAEDFKLYTSAIAVNTGVTLFSVNYRLAPETKCPDNIKDMYAALKYVAANADKFNIDAEKIAIMGEDGGGYICAGLEVMLAQKAESKMIKLAILSKPMLDDYSFGDESLMTFEEKEAASVQRAFWESIAVDLKEQAQDPLLFPGKASKEILGQFPPTIIFQVEFGSNITESTRLARRLRAAGRLLELVVQPGMDQSRGHYSKFAKFHESQEILKKIVVNYLLDQV